MRIYVRKMKVSLGRRRSEKAGSNRRMKIWTSGKDTKSKCEKVRI